MSDLYIDGFKNGRSVSWGKSCFTVWHPSKSGTVNESIAAFELTADGLSLALAYAAKGELSAADSVERANKLFAMGARKAHGLWADS